ncbi:MAG: hypothetical protein AVO39_07515 [delta proteobacterium MLS_D]|jgi:hypothetical protein|nr:MAG: hypothetical protein AVO39_07515 [delta proteobacterium MLS_D]
MSQISGPITGNTGQYQTRSAYFADTVFESTQTAEITANNPYKVVLFQATIMQDNNFLIDHHGIKITI